MSELHDVMRRAMEAQGSVVPDEVFVVAEQIHEDEAREHERPPIDYGQEAFALTRADDEEEQRQPRDSAEQLPLEPGFAQFVTFTERARKLIPPGRVDWSGSPFGWMRHNGPRTKSKLGRDLVEYWLRATGTPFQVGENGTHHFVVHGHAVVVHFCLQGKEGLLEFANLREPGLGADRLWLLGIEPQRARIWEVLPERVRELPHYTNDAEGYHNCSFDPEDVPEWARLIAAWE